jgi:hypothetical protein
MLRSLKNHIAPLAGVMLSIFMLSSPLFAQQDLDPQDITYAIEAGAKDVKNRLKVDNGLDYEYPYSFLGIE